MTPPGAEIRARYSAGMFYGVRTLLQLVEGSIMPVVEILDWPSLPYRGVRMDLSRGNTWVEELERCCDDEHQTALTDSIDGRAFF